MTALFVILGLMVAGLFIPLVFYPQIIRDTAFRTPRSDAERRETMGSLMFVCCVMGAFVTPIAIVLALLHAMKPLWAKIERGYLKFERWLGRWGLAIQRRLSKNKMANNERLRMFLDGVDDVPREPEMTKAEKDAIRETFDDWEDAVEEEMDAASRAALFAEMLEDAGIDPFNPPEWL